MHSIYDLNSFKFINLPTGDICFTCCDSNYYKKFSSDLISSFESNKIMEKLHFHIINPDNELLSQFELNKSTYITYSYEFTDLSFSIDNDIASKISSDVLSMLILEQYRNHIVLRKIIKILIMPKITRKLFLSIDWLKNMSSKVFFACRRFMMPLEFYKGINSILIIDIDSEFHAGFDRNIFIGKPIMMMSSKNKWSSYLAGLVYLEINKTCALDFITSLRALLLSKFHHGEIFWGVDQVSIDEIASRCIINKFDDKYYSFNGTVGFFHTYKGSIKWKRGKF